MYNPGNYFFPGYGMVMPGNFRVPTRGLGLFRRLGGSLGFLRNINWGNLFSNTSRALGVVNQAIPLVRQAGPMFSNMRSMLKVMSAFKDVTDDDRKNIKKSTRVSSTQNNNFNINNIQNNVNNNFDNLDTNNYNYNSNNPKFFI